ncbi:LIM domain kinase 1 isoform X1 [Podarcis lilfordi]|uniref:LIM domain kinase 1 isoform X1 n=1 Tax=Podarcis lilfordi TaxID=74358 RepID=A0AA35LFZ0_9SAUR|nr:LIM domain kinase 1 isoform X1 [Podarcis lilfordi]
MRLMLLCCTWRDEPMGEDEGSDLPICASCSHNIYDGQYLQALNADWHTDCFRLNIPSPLQHMFQVPGGEGAKDESHLPPLIICFPNSLAAPFILGFTVPLLLLLGSRQYGWWHLASTETWLSFQETHSSHVQLGADSLGPDPGCFGVVRF